MSTTTTIVMPPPHAYPPGTRKSMRILSTREAREPPHSPPPSAEEDAIGESPESEPDSTNSEEAPDSSTGALKFLVASFVVACVIWSFPNAYGIFLDYYLTRTPLGQKPNARFLLSLSGTCQSGVTYCSSPLVNYLQRRYPKYFEAELWVGVVLVSSSLALTSLATEPYQIVLLQGLMYAVGATLLYSSFISLMPEWFVRRRGLASGVIFAGTSIGGVFLPYLLTTLLNKYGGQTTLRGLGIAVFIVLSVAVPFLRRRVRYTSPKSFSYKRPANTTEEKEASWWKSSILWLFGIATTAQAMGFFVTMLYLPSFASSLGLTDIKGTTALALLNAAGTLSRLGAGFLADYISPYTVAAISLSASGLSVFLLWGLASTSFGALVAFSLVFGLLSTGFTSLATGVIKDLAGEDASQSVMLFGVITFTRGLGNVLASPISSALLNQADASKPPAGPADNPSHGTVYETVFSGVVIFSGVSMLAAGALSLLANVMNSRRKKRQ